MSGYYPYTMRDLQKQHEKERKEFKKTIKRFHLMIDHPHIYEFLRFFDLKEWKETLSNPDTWKYEIIGPFLAMFFAELVAALIILFLFGSV